MKEIDKIALLYLKDGQILSTLSKGSGVRIDIWTHFMRECIINYVH